MPSLWVSPAPGIVAVSDEDIWLHQRPSPDDPDAPPMINPWVEEYSESVKNSIDLDKLL